MLLEKLLHSKIGVGYLVEKFSTDRKKRNKKLGSQSTKKFRCDSDVKFSSFQFIVDSLKFKTMIIIIHSTIIRIDKIHYDVS